MVARIKCGNSLRNSFFYNETKVEMGVAKWIHAENYPLKQDELGQNLRLKMLEKTAAMKPNIKVNSVHISLNFDPSEVISEEQYIRIAKEYMDRLGFGNQPYLIYQHFDAAHPHIHILTTNVVSEKERIDLHHLGIRKSEPARKEVEKLFNLVEAEGKNSIDYKLEPISAEKILYGKRETKKALCTVLEALHKRYKYTSLAEFNALLKLYNIRADRGGEDSRIYKNGGLLFRILDTEGRPIGVPIKASAFHFKPTLKNLETHFKESGENRKPYKERLRNSIDFYFLKARMPSIKGLIRSLEKSGIAVTLHQNDQGGTFGITYVDHRTRCVFNGSDLGKDYSAKTIQERCSAPIRQLSAAKIPASNVAIRTWPAAPFRYDQTPELPFRIAAGTPIEDLIWAEHDSSYLPYELTGKKKKKKKKKGR